MDPPAATTASHPKNAVKALPTEDVNIVSNIFSGLIEGEACQPPVLERQKFRELFPMPDPVFDVIFHAFSGRENQFITRTQFVAGIEAIVIGGNSSYVRFLFGDSTSLTRAALESVLSGILKGFYLVVFHQVFPDGRLLPGYVVHELQERAGRVVDEFTSGLGSSQNDDNLPLCDLIKFIKEQSELRRMIQLVCQNIGNIPGFASGDNLAIQSSRDILQQIIHSAGAIDCSWKAWRQCASDLMLPSPDLESTIRYAPTAFEGALDDSSSSSSSSVSSQPPYLANPLPLMSSCSSKSLLCPNVRLPASEVPIEEIYPSSRAEDESALRSRHPGLFKVCQHCELAIDVRFCVECGAGLTRRGLDLGCESCAAQGHRLRYKCCARCGSRDLVDHRLNLDIPTPSSRVVTGLSMKKGRRPKKGIRGFVAGDLQEWFYVYDERTEQWSACWALTADQFLVLFKRIPVGPPYRILSLQDRRLEIDEYHGDHDEYVIKISPSADEQDDGCMIITTEKEVGNRWLQQMRLGTRRRAFDDYYAMGESVFELDRLIQRYNCRHLISKEKCVVTVVNKSVFEADQIKKIRSEIGLFKLIRHPTLISVKDVFESDSQFRIVVPQLSGGYLSKALLRKGHFEESVVRLVVYPIVNALVRVHRAGIHLINIRPECVIVTPYSQHLVQIAHLDINKVLVPAEVLEYHLPTRLFAYRAPEALSSDSPSWVWGPPLDMWAIGILMYELLTGELPFEPLPGLSFDYSEALKEKFASNSIWNHLSQEVKAVIQSLLSVDPDQRPSADSLLDSAWFSLRL